MEASALAQQVEELGRSLSKSKDVIDPEARKMALEKLIELRRLEQLKAIAESKSNSTYFFGDRCMLPHLVPYQELLTGCSLLQLRLARILIISTTLSTSKEGSTNGMVRQDLPSQIQQLLQPQYRIVSLS
jgi:hypothetical protein